MNTKHTPTPWKYDDKTRNILAADGSIVCRNGDSVYGYPETGPLLADSLGLLEALETAAKVMFETLSPDMPEQAKAISKAR